MNLLLYFFLCIHQWIMKFFISMCVTLLVCHTQELVFHLSINVSSGLHWVVPASSKHKQESDQAAEVYVLRAQYDRTRWCSLEEKHACYHQPSAHKNQWVMLFCSLSHTHTHTDNVISNSIKNLLSKGFHWWVINSQTSEVYKYHHMFLTATC